MSQVGGSSFRRPRGALWEKLLAGRITEVYAVGDRGWTTALPQTLGLEPIYYDAYTYHPRTGLPRSAVEVEQIARSISAQRRWIAGGGPLAYWDRYFAERAQVVLVFLSAASLTRYDFEIKRATAGAVVKELLTRRRTRRESDPDVFSILDVSPPQPRPTVVSFVRGYLLSEFPDKTFVITDPSDRALLRRVRALPSQPSAS